MLKSAKSADFDQIVVSWNGDRSDTLAILESFDVEIHRWKWNDNFSDARNHALSLCKTDYVMYLDSDEELHRGELIRTFFDQSPDFDRCFIPLDYWAGRIVYWKLRIIRNGLYRYAGALHDEVYLLDETYKERPGVYLPDVLVSHDYSVGGPVRIERNIRVTGKEFRENKTWKTTYDHALTLFDGGKNPEATPLLIEVAEDLDAWPCYRFMAMRHLVAMGWKSADAELMKKYAATMIDLHPERPDGYFKLAAGHLLADEFAEARAASIEGFSRDMVTDGMPLLYEEFSLDPAKVYIVSLIRSGEACLALQVILHTLNTYPEDEWLNKAKAELDNAASPQTSDV